MRNINTRPRRDLKPVDYRDPDIDNESTDSEDIIPYAPLIVTHRPAETVQNASETLEIEDSMPDTDMNTPMEMDRIDDLDDSGEYDEEGLLPSAMVLSNPAQSYTAIYESRNKHYSSSTVGFMSLPPELRLKIYKLVLVKKPSVDFGSRRGFKHSSGLLSVCKVVAEEAAVVLYSMNHFIFRPSRNQIGTYFEEHWRWLGYSSTLQFLQDIGPRNLAHLKTIGFAFQDATPTDEPRTSGEERRFQHNADLYRSLEILVKHATNLEIIKLQFSGREKFIHKRNAGTLNFGNLLGQLQADVVIISEVRNGEYDTAELWRIDVQGTPLSSTGSLWTQYWVENRITSSDENDFIERMTRKTPLNPRLKEKHAHAIKKSKEEGRNRRYPYH